MMTHSFDDVTHIRADQLPSIHTDRLTKGDVIEHLKQTLEVYTEPKYTQQGIVFEVLPLDSEDNLRQVCFDPDWRFDYITYNSQEVA